ncbi:MAG: CDP-alcohol phosphatidyltransferase [Anaerolineae bacterium]|nr:CDP-alcohol phosphatidyltransferase [Anaerolineae bacterium]
MGALSSRQFFILRAWAVHFYTSLGLPFAFLALDALYKENAHLMFIYLAICMFIDSTDGTLARSWKVTTWVPQFDGRRLDDIIDYMTYAFIPLFFSYRFGLVTGEGGLFTLFIVMIAAVYGFCQKAAKTNDGYFTGFPNYWNIVIFYLYLLGTPPVINSIILLVFAALIFVPVGYASFSTIHLRRLVVTVSGLYGVVLLFMLILWDRLTLPIILISMAFPLLYTAISLYLHFTRRTTA